MNDISSQTLHIVAKELAITLNDARAAIEAYAERPDQRAQLEKCADLLHLAHGALRLVEVYGAALLAEEMEHVTRYLLGAGADQKRQHDGLDALMRAMVQLPTYLERVLSGGRDMALVLLPLLNDLRSVRGSPLLSEGTLLLLNLKSDAPAQPLAQHPGEQLTVTQWARRLRPKFQLALLGYIRGERTVQNLEVLSRVAEKLEQIATSQPVFQLWWVVGAVIEALRTNGLEGSATLKRLLGQSDRQIKLLYELGEARYGEDPPIDLLNNLLYYVARASTSGGRISAVRASFKLAELLPVDDSVEQARESLSAPSVKLMHTVAAAIKEDLSKVKDVLDIFVRRGGGASDELAPQLELLKKISDTLGVLGLGELRQRVQQEIGELAEIATEGKVPPGESLVRVAGVLLSVEDSLDEQLLRLILPAGGENGAPVAAAGAPDGEFRQVSEAVLRECIVNMARIKEAVTLAVAKPTDFAPQGLDNVPQLLRGITAGLLMLGKTRAVELMEAIGNEVRRLVEPGATTPDPLRLERIADAMVSLEYYMETLQNGRSDPWYMLDNAERSLRALADPSPRVPSITLPGVEAGQTVKLDAPAGETVALERARRVHAQTAPLMSLPEPEKVDPQFVELFIEEAKEEIDSIRHNFPLWDQNPMDLESLSAIRRSFHTLKGSGRMVGARTMAEFAWSVENLLNRLIDTTLTRTPAMMGLLRAAMAALPPLVEQLETGRPAAVPVEQLMARAFALADGREQDAAAPLVASEDHPFASDVQRATARGFPEAAPPPADYAATQVLLPQNTAAVPVAVPLPSLHTQAAESPSAAPSMDPSLHDIYSKETSSHLQEIREYLDKRAGQPPPHDLPESVYRAIHTLSGSSKMAEARHGIRITEPLNAVMRKVFDAGFGLSAEGLDVLDEAVRAIDNVVTHINESTGYFVHQPALLDRLNHLEQEVDAEMARQSAEQSAAAMTSEVSVPAFHAPAEPASPAYESGKTAHEGPVHEEPAHEDAVHADAAHEDAVHADAVHADAAHAGAAHEDAVHADAAYADAAHADAAHEDAAYEHAVHEEATSEDAAHDDGVHDDGVHEEAVHEEALREHSAPGEDREEEAAHEEFEHEPTGYGAQAPVGTASTQAAPDEGLEPAQAPTGTAEPEPDMAHVMEFDSEIAGIYTEEATELFEAAETSMAAWNRDRRDQQAVAELQRTLHTLKGGARMAGIVAMGDLSHELETLVIQIENGGVAADDRASFVLQSSLDELARMRDSVVGGSLPNRATGLVAQIRALIGGQPPPVEATILPAPAAAGPTPPSEPVAPELEAPATPLVVPAPEALLASEEPEILSEASLAPQSFEPAYTEASPPLQEAAVADAAEARDEEPDFAPQSHEQSLPAQSIAGESLPPPPAAEVAALSESFVSALESTSAPILPGREQAAPVERAEMARVDADLLDTMLNNAGEVSIFRSRLDQQVNSIDFNLAELSRTVTRLKEQLRGLEIETEAQVMNRHQDEHPRRDDFDPLELDRYSSLQQFSRALAETSGDVASIQGLLETLTREAQNLLTQQARVITELQNSLMRTRMVPFQRHVQRLTRLVRQAANDTGKRAELVVQGAAAELDRQMLERIVPPLEHMLRNAVVHGIEMPERRISVGKPETGRISISLERDGAEVVVIVDDDGAGINVKLIREKALALGLTDAHAKLTDEEAMQLILEPGFSTAGHVTQAAGRGVGMDVVATEVKKLGGGLFIDSTLGKGTRFTIRLPFTLAISQALIVRVAEEVYALPLATVEGVVRLPRNIVMRHLAKDAPLFEYGSQKYRFQQLGAFVGLGATRLPDTDVSMPVVLIRAGEHSTALVTDELVGSREIVVKSLGPQVSAIRGIAGATILGDGRIVIILDMGSLVRSEWRAKAADIAVLDQRDRRTFALVVDDSITVRRVTQRLLERNGMRVLTAKDGVDAVSLLQENLPDVILLDIEMPRMDGYEVAAHVRNDARLKHIPIVMITSRVSEKHRARAIELGVDDYLGKPYQESQLLDAIEPLVNRRAALAR